MSLKRVLVVLALALAAVSCSSEGPAPEKALRYRVREPAPTLDPFQAADDNSLVYIYPIFDGLVEFVPGTVDVRPAVAESWTLSDDHLTYTFKLRPGVRFHHGRELTADDVVYSVRRALTKDAKSLKRTFFNALKGAAEFWDGATTELAGVVASDPRTVIMTLSYPYEAFLSVLASEAGSIVPKEVYSDPAGGYLSHPVGCGPFMFESAEPGVSVTLTRFAGHWKSAPRDGIQKILFRVIESPSTALEEYRAGTLDFTQEFPPGQRTRLRQEMPDHFHNWRKLQLFYLEFNHASGPFKEKRLLRQAILHAVDKEFIVKTLQEDKDVVATGIIPPAMLGHTPGQPSARYDPDMAADLLARAGYPGGKGLPEIIYHTNDSMGLRLLAERVQSDLARIGLKVSIKMMDFGAFLAALRTNPEKVPALSLVRQAFYADYPDPDNFLTEMLAPSGSGNTGHYDNPALTSQLDAARREPDHLKREALYQGIEKLALDDAAIVPIYWMGQDILLRPEVGGFTGSPLGLFGIPWEEMSLNR
ncbi:MAG TPA: ABC transporter substrate-binding protein [Candidatus Polarisedimenticolia bacterium]|jgi:peptide/nickel transport system substrate-binding protein/oligopeptide transport system substrate-binding protein